MNEKLYRIRCRTGYAILGETPPKMDETAMYRLLGESIYYPHCFVVERYDRKEYAHGAERPESGLCSNSHCPLFFGTVAVEAEPVSFQIAGGIWG